MLFVLANVWSVIYDKCINKTPLLAIIQSK